MNLFTPPPIKNNVPVHYVSRVARLCSSEIAFLWKLSVPRRLLGFKQENHGWYGSCLISRYFLHQPFRQTKHIHMTYFVGCFWLADNMTIPCDTTTLSATASRPSSTSSPPSPLLTCHTETPAMIKNTKIVNTVPSTSVQNATQGFCKRKRANHAANVEIG